MAGSVRVRAYSSSANLGPGFDVLAVAHTAYYDEVEVRLEPGTGQVVVESVYGPYASQAGRADTARRAVEELLKITGTDVSNHDIVLRVYKGVPPGRGLGSSGASAAAAVKAVELLLDLNVSDSILVKAAGRGEAAAAGSPHYDNVAASLLGGLTIVSFDKDGQLYVSRIEVDAWFALFVPKIEIGSSKTKLMREILPRQVSLDIAARNWGRLAMLIAAAMRGDLRLMGHMMMQDEIVEPIRSRYIPCYDTVVEAALEAGALGVTISGAGPALIALASSREDATRIAEAMTRSCKCCEIEDVKIAQTAGPATKVKW
ncbi:Homoserine kinase [Pyrodictium delaneyi]|uniref:Homoserine kinase n=1 Tax=Pyrodictium delaneyi TaxID=1273541 RepID=A0A0P0N1E8_9CREN|nr:homoserine kinase [Pyrodictium delaneyi]ALL00070.1 Homoserine kinase [Pyrodictium delaneyi]OWJ54762.1 homoserine kinase [Pyrodictium delaneyi]